MSPHVDPITTEYQITPKHGMLKQWKFLWDGHGLDDSLVSHEVTWDLCVAYMAFNQIMPEWLFSVIEWMPCLPSQKLF